MPRHMKLRNLRKEVDFQILRARANVDTGVQEGFTGFFEGRLRNKFPKTAEKQENICPEGRGGRAHARGAPSLIR